MKAGPFQIPLLPLDSQQLEFWNAAMTHAGSAIGIPDAEMCFTFQPGEAPSQKKAVFAVSLVEGPIIYLVVESFDFSEWTGTDLSDNEVSALPATIRKALDRGIIDLILNYLPQAMRERVTDMQALEPARLAREAKSRPISWLRVDLALDESDPIPLTLGLRVEELAAILGRESLDHVLGNSAALAAIAVPLRYSLGTITLGLDEVAGLSCGDLILLDAKSSKSVFYVTSPHARYGFTLQDNNWTCFEVAAHDVPESGGGREMEAEFPESEESGGNALDRIPVRLEFDVGSLTVPVGDLAQWRPGTIVEISPPRLDESIEVHIRAHGKWIASGDLVRVGERLAVRLARLAGRMQEDPEDSGDDS
jgi:type III secretion system YscQ/HrcQ family protein